MLFYSSAWSLLVCYISSNLMLQLALFGGEAWNILACVASVSVEQRKTEERGFRYFACAENGARAKKRTVGVGEGKEGTACGQTPGF